MNIHNFKRDFQRKLTELVMYSALHDGISLGSVMADCLQSVDRMCVDYLELCRKHDELVSKSSADL